MTSTEGKEGGLDEEVIQETFKSLRLDALRRTEPGTIRRALNDFGILRDVPLTADNVTRPLEKDPENAELE